MAQSGRWLVHRTCPLLGTKRTWLFAAAVPEDHDQFQALTQVIYCVFQTPEDLRAQTVARNADDKEVVWTLVEYQFDWDASVGAPKNDSKGMLFWSFPGARQQSQLSRINWHDTLNNVLICRAFKKSSERLVTVFQTAESCIRVRWPKRSRRVSRLISIDDVDYFHDVDASTTH
jgi:hypothetical protein